MCMLSAKYGFGLSADFVAQTLDLRSTEQIRGSHSSLRYQQIVLAQTTNEMHAYLPTVVSAAYTCRYPLVSVEGRKRQQRATGHREAFEKFIHRNFSTMYACTQIRGWASGRSVINAPRRFYLATVV